MSGETTTLQAVCVANLLHTKWLFAPSYRTGHQWIENLVRSGQSIVNLHPTTLSRLALNIVGPDLAKAGLTLASRSVGPLVVDAAWDQLPSDGYLGRLDRSADLSIAVFQTLLELRMAGLGQIDASHLESEAKAEDLKFLGYAYQEFLKNHKLVDESDVLRRAAAKLNAEPNGLGTETLVLVPTGIKVAALELQFLEAIPQMMRIEIRHPLELPNAAAAPSDIPLLANIGKAVAALPPTNDGSVQLFRAVGEVNEVREVLRRILSGQKPLDQVEILYTDSETYVPLIFGIARRHFSEPDRPNGIPVTFAEGIPASLSRPGRALAGWLHWIGENYPQRLLVEMIGEGLLNCGDDEELSFSSLMRLFRPIGIGLGAENYLPNLDEQIKAINESSPKPNDDGEEDVLAIKARERKLKGLKALRKLTGQLLILAQEFVSAAGPGMLKAAEKFLNTAARSISELDRSSSEALIEQLQDRQMWMERLGVTFDLRKWLRALPSQTRALSSGPRPGHIHVAPIGSGGQSGRDRTFVMGLDERRFPGAMLQDPILLDRERSGLCPELCTSTSRLQQKVEELAVLLSRLKGQVVLSWPCQDLADGREIFPSSAVLSCHRLISGLQDADLETLNQAAGPPASFAPTAPEQALDESERWLWQLSEEGFRGRNQLSQVEAFYPHLARGSEARRQRLLGFGSFNGYVPEAGQDLNPFTDQGPVLSASALETAGRCPLAFFFRNGLNLFTPDEWEADPDRWIDAAQFGSLMHEVFRQFLKELSRAGQSPDFERDHLRLAEILKETVEQWRSDVPPPNENAFRVQYWQLVRTSRIFLQAEEEFCRTSRPLFFEVALGLDKGSSDSPLDDAEAMRVTLPSGRSIRVRGQIDRVDELGASRYSVWDYKIGSGYGYDRADPFQQGRRLQSLLYLRLIETALKSKLDPGAVVKQFGYFFPSIRAHGLRVAWDAGALSPGWDILDRVCHSIEAGAFLATDKPDDCRFCDYSSICRDVHQVTGESKALLDQEDWDLLTHFRELRRV